MALPKISEKLIDGAGVAPRDEDPANGYSVRLKKLPRLTENSADPVEHGWKNRPTKNSRWCRRQRRPVALAVPSALSETRLAIFGLADTGERAVPDNLNGSNEPRATTLNFCPAVKAGPGRHSPRSRSWQSKKAGLWTCRTYRPSHLLHPGCPCSGLSLIGRLSRLAC